MTESMEGKEGFALLGRRDGGSLEVLAFEAEGGRALCLFDSQELADAFARIAPSVRGQGWAVHVMANERLPELLSGFDYVAINPSPQSNARHEVISAVGFARSLESRGDPSSG